MSQRKHDYQARRLNFYNLSDEETDNVIDLCLSDEEEEDDTTDVINLDDTPNDASLLDALLPFDPLESEGEGFMNEPVTPPPTPTSWEDEPTILYGEGLLQ